MNRVSHIGIMVTVWGLLMVIGISTTSAAHGAGGRGRANDQIREAQAFEIGQRNGFEQGRQEGRRDRRLSQRYRESVPFPLRDNRWGDVSRYRYEDDYRRGFRSGYAAGYRAGFNFARR
ncbi:MAG: hypothetical protein ACOYLF_11575 [Blastocatellia bacterium]|jgi:hypothetical protein